MSELLVSDMNRGDMNRPLRILVTYNAPGRRTGGMSRIMGLIHDQLAADGHQIDYLCSEDLSNGMNGRAARLTFPMLVLGRALSAARSGQRYDVINVHEPVGAAITLGKRLAGGGRVVVTSHGVEQRAWERNLEESRLGREGPSLRSRIVYPATVLWQTRIAFRHSDHIFCLNMEDRAYLTSRFGIPERKITRIFPAADPIYGEVAGTRDYSRAETLVFAGTWLKRKGTEDMVTAFSRLAANHPRLKLMVLNGGASESAVRAEFPEELRGRVSAVRSEPERGNAETLAGTDIFVLPSLFEGTPLTIMEAMWSGLPIVTTATCGMKDVIEDGRNGLLVPIRSADAIVAAIERLLADSSMRAALGRAAHAEARANYTWQRAAEPVRNAYQELCGGALPEITPVQCAN